MADSRISDLPALTGSAADADDEFVIVDVYPNANQSKKIKLSELVIALNQQAGTVDTLTEVLANGNTTGGTDIAVSVGDDITFADSSKAIFGAGSDLQIYSDGTNSWIEEHGGGDLYIEATNLTLRALDNTVYATFADAGASTIYHAGAQKLQTASTGIDVTGTITTDGLTVSDSTGIITIQDNDNNQNTSTSKILFNHSSGNIGFVGFDGSQNMSLWNANYGALYFGTNNANRMIIDNAGVISIHNDSAFDTDSTATSATTQTTIHSFSATTYTGAKLLVCVTDSTATERYITEILVTHDGTTAVATEYGQVATNTALATFDVDISGGNVRLLATPASLNSMTFKVMSTQLLA